MKVDELESFKENPKNEGKWIGNAEKLMDQSQKFLNAMKKLQRAVHHNKEREEGESISTPKQQFEVHKKILEQVIKETKL